MNPGVSVGTRNAVIPTAEPSWPEVRAKIRSWVARCTPVLQRLAPLITQSSPSRYGGGLHAGGVALPWLGSVSPKAIERLPVEHRLDPVLLLGVGAEPAAS